MKSGNLFRQINRSYGGGIKGEAMKSTVESKNRNKPGYESNRKKTICSLCNMIPKSTVPCEGLTKGDVADILGIKINKVTQADIELQSKLIVSNCIAYRVMPETVE